ncbi:hypothetical protein [Alishewanella longhuensis]
MAQLSRWWLLLVLLFPLPLMAEPALPQPESGFKMLEDLPVANQNPATGKSFSD